MRTMERGTSVRVEFVPVKASALGAGLVPAAAGVGAVGEAVGAVADPGTATTRDTAELKTVVSDHPLR